MDEYMPIADPAIVGQGHPSGLFEHRNLIVERRPERAPPRRSRTCAHLAPWQAKLARDMMLTQMGGGLALEDVACRLNMSVSHFIKAFRGTEGVAPYHWYMQRRIDQAIILLRDDRMPLSKVADECGFADQSHFTKAFTRLLGVSPGRWRRSMRSGPPNTDG
ncbi:helix-turn-helix domain-containing protein [Sphingomonas gei]|uniref:helix-turn-helix domain-containing protein n=1 Tax=Sphingomonas gei TaxID=1395960 RepID=UPI0014428D50|nr:AraC family transcriptional regulator [Sphingomonas gei]